MDFLHAVNILRETHLIVTGFGTVVPHQLLYLGPVGREFLLGDLLEHLQVFLLQVLLDRSQDLVPLQSLTGDLGRGFSESTTSLTKLSHSGISSSQSSMMI